MVYPLDQFGLTENYKIRKFATKRINFNGFKFKWVWEILWTIMNVVNALKYYFCGCCVQLFAVNSVVVMSKLYGNGNLWKLWILWENMGPTVLKKLLNILCGEVEFSAALCILIFWRWYLLVAVYIKMFFGWKEPFLRVEWASL